MAFNIDPIALALLFAAVVSAAAWHYLVTTRVHVGFENVLLKPTQVFNMRRLALLTPIIPIGIRARAMEWLAISYALLAIILTTLDLIGDNFDSFSKRAFLDKTFGFDNTVLDVSLILGVTIGANLILALAVYATKPSHSYNDQLLYSTAGKHTTPGARLGTGAAAPAEREHRMPNITREQFRALLTNRDFVGQIIKEHKLLHSDTDTDKYYDAGPTDEELLLEFFQSRRKGKGPD